MEKIQLISLPLSPAKFISKEPTVISENAAKISMSAGGGMGGSFWEEYIIDYNEQLFTNNNGLVKVRLYNHTTKLINTRNIVEIKPTKIIQVCLTHSNCNFTDNYREMYFITDDVNNVKLCNLAEYNELVKDPNYTTIKPFVTNSSKIYF